MPKKAPTLEIFQGTDSQWYWRLRAKNGEIIIPPEGHKDSRGPARAIRAVQGMFERGEIKGPVVDTSTRYDIFPYNSGPDMK